MGYAFWVKKYQQWPIYDTRSVSNEFSCQENGEKVRTLSLSCLFMPESEQNNVSQFKLSSFSVKDLVVRIMYVNPERLLSCSINVPCDSLLYHET